jgi:TRAP-type mannitol/chloroaromatic compound transport system permease small subunit
MKKIISLFVGSLLLTVMTVTGASAQTLKCQTVISAKADEVVMLKDFTDTVTELTGGSLKFEIMPAGSVVGVKETLDITDELIAERRTSLKMPKDMVPWMAKTIEFIDLNMLRVGKIVCWMVIPLIFAMTFEVIGRHFFNRPTLWAYDVTRMIAGAFFMLGAGYALSKGIHIRADFLYRNWKVKTQAKVDLFLYLLFFFPGFIVFFWVSFDYAYTSICGKFILAECLDGKVRIQRAMDTTWMPVMWPLKICMPIGAFLLLIQGISELFKTYYAFVKGRWP